MRPCYSWLVLALLIGGGTLPVGQLAAQEHPVKPLTLLETWHASGSGLGPFVYGTKAKDGNRPVQTCDQAIGQRVQAEGIAWAPPLAVQRAEGDSLAQLDWPRVILEGGTVFFRGVDCSREEIHGKLVRVVGTLQPHAELNARVAEFYKMLEGNEFPPPPERTLPRYYVLQAASLEEITRATEPQLVLQPTSK